MNDTQVKVGAVVPWSQVPDGAMVRWMCAGRGLEYYYRRHAHVVSLVGAPGMEWRAPGGDDGTFDSSEPVIIVALGLTGKETAADLQRLAEVYEVREHLMRTGDDSIWYGQDLDELAPLLQAAGWRPGMSAEDAARLLASMKVAWLDRAKPPPGYEVDDYSDVEFHWSAPDEHYDLGLDEHCGSGTKAECMAAAWAHFEAEYDPPGMQVFVWPKEKASEPTSWCIAPHGKRHVAECATEPEASSAAWAWYWRRLAAVEAASTVEWAAHGDPLNLWPRALSWTDDQVEEVERWAEWHTTRGQKVARPPALPKVLRIQAAGRHPEDTVRLLAARDAGVRARVAGHLEGAVHALADLCRTLPIAECPPHVAAVRRLAALAVEYGSQDPRLHPDRVHTLLAR